MIHYTDKDIEIAIANISKLHCSPITRHYKGYIILAYSEADFKIKISKIQRGDTLGFYTIEQALDK